MNADIPEIEREVVYALRVMQTEIVKRAAIPERERVRLASGIEDIVDRITGRNGVPQAGPARPARKLARLPASPQDGPQEGACGSSLSSPSEQIPGGKTEPKTEGQEEIDPDGFLAFWGIYPKKKDRKAARNAFRKLSPHDRTAATQDVSARRSMDPQWIADGGAYVPYPSTYLNGRRWEDEWQKLGEFPEEPGRETP